MKSEKVKSKQILTISNTGDFELSEQPNVASIQLNGDTQKFILDKKDFSTGSKGYYGQGKMVAGGKKYQINIQVVEIGSKAAAAKEKEK